MVRPRIWLPTQSPNIRQALWADTLIPVIWQKEKISARERMPDVRKDSLLFRSSRYSPLQHAI